jgi:hypothetical protein
LDTRHLWFSPSEIKKNFVSYCELLLEKSF